MSILGISYTIVTLFHLWNKLNRTNVVNNGKNNFNACEDFCYSCDYKSIKEVSKEVVITDPENEWMQTSEERKATLKDICLKIIDDFSFATEDSSMTRCFNMQSRF